MKEFVPLESSDVDYKELYNSLCEKIFEKRDKFNNYAINESARAKKNPMFYRYSGEAYHTFTELNRICGAISKVNEKEASKAANDSKEVG